MFKDYPYKKSLAYYSVILCDAIAYAQKIVLDNSIDK